MRIKPLIVIGVVGAACFNCKGSPVASTATLRVAPNIDDHDHDHIAKSEFENAEEFNKRKLLPFNPNRATHRERREVHSRADRARALYRKVAGDEDSQWSMAACLRVGDVYYWESVNIASMEDLGINYNTDVGPLEEAAAKHWSTVVTIGKKHTIKNEWTLLAQERLYDFVSRSEYPLSYEQLLTRANKWFSSGRYKVAAKVYEDARKVNPQGLVALTRLGYCALHSNHFKIAQARFGAALKIAPRHADALWGVAEGYQKQGLDDAAIAAYQTFIDEYPVSPQAETAKQRMNQLRDQ